MRFQSGVAYRKFSSEMLRKSFCPGGGGGLGGGPDAS